MPPDLRDRGLDRGQCNDPSGAVDRERATADGRNLHGSAQEVSGQNGSVGNDVRLNYRFEWLPVLLSQKPVEHGRRQLVECFIGRGENRKGSLAPERFSHARGLEQLQEAIEPADLLRGLDDVGGLHRPSTEGNR